MGNQLVPGHCTKCKEPIKIEKATLTPNGEPLCNNCKTVTLHCDKCKSFFQQQGIPAGYTEEECKMLQTYCEVCRDETRKSKHTIVTCATCHTTINLYGEYVTDDNGLISCEKCAQDTQRKHTAGKFRQVEVTDSRAGIKRMVFTKELHSQATATPNMQQLMLTASAGPKVKPK